MEQTWVLTGGNTPTKVKVVGYDHETLELDCRIEFDYEDALSRVFSFFAEGLTGQVKGPKNCQPCVSSIALWLAVQSAYEIEDENAQKADLYNICLLFNSPCKMNWSLPRDCTKCEWIVSKW